MKWKTIIGLICFVLWSCACLGVGYYFHPKTILIDKPTYKYIKVATTPAQLLACYESRIEITTKAEPDSLHITARDSCKQTDIDVSIERKVAWTWTGAAAGIGLIIGLLL